MPNYRMRMSGAKTAEIYLYDEIGAGWGGGISAKQFAEDLTALGKVDTLNIRMNSPGGDVFDGLAIYNTLKRHPANVIVDVDGMALSIASVIAMAGDTINMAGNAMMMIHDPWTVAAGTAEDFRKQADIMDQVKVNLAQTYAARTQTDEDQIMDMMTEETWMTATEARAAGFADDVTDSLDMAAKFDLSRFKKAPQSVAKAVSAKSGGADFWRAKIAALANRAHRRA